MLFAIRSNLISIFAVFVKICFWVITKDALSFETCAQSNSAPFVDKEMHCHSDGVYVYIKEIIILLVVPLLLQQNQPSQLPWAIVIIMADYYIKQHTL